jgi:hypothetical protein
MYVEQQLSADSEEKCGIWLPQLNTRKRAPGQEVTPLLYFRQFGIFSEEFQL